MNVPFRFLLPSPAHPLQEKSRWKLGGEEVNPNLDQIVRPGPLPDNWKDLVVKVAPAAVIPADLNAAQAPLADNFSSFAPPPGNLMQLNGEHQPPGGGLRLVPGPPPPAAVVCDSLSLTG